MQKIDRPLRMGGGLEDGALVIGEDLEPVSEIGGMVRAWLELWHDAQIGAKQRRADFRDIS